MIPCNWRPYNTTIFPPLDHCQVRILSQVISMLSPGFICCYPKTYLNQDPRKWPLPSGRTLVLELANSFSPRVLQEQENNSRNINESKTRGDREEQLHLTEEASYDLVRCWQADASQEQQQRLDPRIRWGREVQEPAPGCEKAYMFSELITATSSSISSSGSSSGIPSSPPPPSATTSSVLTSFFFLSLFFFLTTCYCQTCDALTVPVVTCHMSLAFLKNLSYLLPLSSVGYTRRKPLDGSFLATVDGSKRTLSRCSLTVRRLKKPPDCMAAFYSARSSRWVRLRLSTDICRMENMSRIRSVLKKYRIYQMHIKVGSHLGQSKLSCAPHIQDSIPVGVPDLFITNKDYNNNNSDSVGGVVEGIRCLRDIRGSEP